MKCWVFQALALMSLTGVHAQELSCMRQIETTFFNPAYVDEALSLMEFPQSAWSEVSRKLQQNQGIVPVLVRAKAAAMYPNPLNAPFQPLEAAKVVEESLYELFARVMGEFNVSNPFDIRKIFNHIRERQEREWVACFGKEGAKKD